MQILCNILTASTIILTLMCFRCDGRVPFVSSKNVAENVPKDVSRLSEQSFKEGEYPVDVQQPELIAMPVEDMPLDIMEDIGRALNRTKKFALSSKLPPGSVCVQFNPVQPEDSPFVVCEPIAALESPDRLGMPTRSPYFPPKQQMQPKPESPVVVLPSDVLHKLTASNQMSLPLSYYEEPRPYSFSNSPTIPSYVNPYFTGMLPSYYSPHVPTAGHYIPIQEGFKEEIEDSSALQDTPEGPAKKKVTQQPQRPQQGKYTPSKTSSTNEPTSLRQRFSEGINENATSDIGAVSVDSRKVQHAYATKVPYPYNINPIPFAVYNELFHSPEEDTSNQYQGENLLLSPPKSQKHHPHHGLLQPPYRMTCKLDTNSEGANLAQADKYLRPLALLKLMTKHDKKLESPSFYIQSNRMNEGTEMKSSSGSKPDSAEFRESEQEEKTEISNLESNQTSSKERNNQEITEQNKIMYKMSEMETYNYQEKVNQLMEIQHRLQDLQRISSASPSEVAESLSLMAQELQVLAEQQRKLMEEINAHGDGIPYHNKDDVDADAFASLPTDTQEGTKLEIVLDNEPSKDIHSTQFVAQIESKPETEKEQIYLIEEPIYKTNEPGSEKVFQNADQEKQQQRKKVIKDKMLQQYRMETEGVPAQMKAKQENQNISTVDSSQSASQVTDGKEDEDKMQGKESDLNEKEYTDIEKQESGIDSAKPKQETNDSEVILPLPPVMSSERSAINETVKQVNQTVGNKTRESNNDDIKYTLATPSSERNATNETMKGAQRTSNEKSQKSDNGKEKSVQGSLSSTPIPPPPPPERNVPNGKFNETIKEALPLINNESRKSNNDGENSTQDSLLSSLSPALPTSSDERNAINETVMDTQPPSNAKSRKSNSDEEKYTQDPSSSTLSPSFERSNSNETVRDAQPASGSKSRETDNGKEKYVQNSSSPSPSSERSVTSETVRDVQPDSSSKLRETDNDKEQSAQNLPDESSVVNETVRDVHPDSSNKSRETDNDKEKSAQNLSTSPSPFGESSVANETMRDAQPANSSKLRETENDKEKYAQNSSISPSLSGESSVANETVRDVEPDSSSKLRETDNDEEQSAQNLSDESSVTSEAVSDARPDSSSKLRETDNDKEKSAQNSSTSPSPSAERSVANETVNNAEPSSSSEPRETDNDKEKSTQNSSTSPSPSPSPSARSVTNETVNNAEPASSSKSRESDAAEKISSQYLPLSSLPTQATLSPERSSTDKTVKDMQPADSIETRQNDNGKNSSAQVSSSLPSDERSVSNETVKDVQPAAGSKSGESDINAQSSLSSPLPASSEKNPEDEPNKKIKEVRQTSDNIILESDTAKAKASQDSLEINVNEMMQRTAGDSGYPPSAQHSLESDSKDAAQGVKDEYISKPKMIYSSSGKPKDDHSQQYTTESSEADSHLKQSPSNKNMQSADSLDTGKMTAYDSRMSQVTSFQNPPMQDKRWYNMQGSWYTPGSPIVHYPSSAFPAVYPKVFYVSKPYPNNLLIPHSYSTDYTFRDASEQMMARMNAPDLSNTIGFDGTSQSLPGKPLVMLILEQ